MTAVLETTRSSQRLRQKIAFVMPELAAAAHAMRTSPRLREIYPEYLFTTHCMVRATVPLMEAALERSQALASADPVAALMAPYLAKHIPEEDHDYWVLEDLEALGYDRAEMLRRQPPPTVAAMVGCQYYWIFHHHPVALFGYMEIMEGYPPTVEQIDALVAATGYPRSAFRMLSRHVGLDLHHREELHEVLDSLPLSSTQSALVGLSALQSMQFGSRAIMEVVERYPTVTN